MKIVLIGATNIINQRHLNNDPINGNLHELLRREGHECCSIYNKSKDEVLDFVGDFQPDYLCVSINFTMDFGELSDLLKNIKTRVPWCKIIGCGPYITACREYIISDGNFDVFDVFVVGQPEISILKMVGGGEIKRFPNFPKVICGEDFEDVNTLPFPDNQYRNEVSTRISWGCKFNCLFCQDKLISGKYQYRTVDNVIDELKTLYEKRDPNREFWIMFSDLDFLAITGSNPKWIPTFVDKVKENGLKFNFSIQTRANWISDEIVSLLKEIGLESIGIGVEAGSERVLKLYNKGIKDVSYNVESIKTLIRLGVAYKMNFIMYEPTTTMDDIRKNIEYFYKCGYPAGATPSQPAASFFDRLALFPETDAHKYFKAQDGVNLRVDNGRVKYEFRDREVAVFYKYVRKWRENVRSLNQIYFFLLNNTYDLNQYICSEQKRRELLMKLLILQQKYLKIDLEFLDELAHTDIADESALLGVVDKYSVSAKAVEGKLTALKNYYLGKEVEIAINSHTLNTRGYHRQMRSILT